MSLQWVAADLSTGSIIADLPQLDLTGQSLTRTISTVEQATAVLRLDGSEPENWQRATMEEATVLACFDDSDPTQSIMWAGAITYALEDGGSDTVTMTLATYEGCLDNVCVGDVTYTTSWFRDDIAADLINEWFTTEGYSNLELAYTTGGGPHPPVMDSPPTVNAAFVWQNTDNATVKSRLDQLFAQLGGEYTVTWAWDDGGTAITPTLSFGSRVGQAVQAGFAPAVTFEMPGVLTSITRGRDYSQGKGANKVLAYSTGQGNTTPYSDPQLGPEDGRPTVEFRWQPAASVSKTALNQYAKQAVPILAPGARPISLVASTARTDGRRLGTDWDLGDDIGYNIPPFYVNEQGAQTGVRVFPQGLSGVGRVMSVAVDDSSVTPTLADKTVYVQADSS